MVACFKMLTCCGVKNSHCHIRALLPSTFVEATGKDLCLIARCLLFGYELSACMHAWLVARSSYHGTASLHIVRKLTAVEHHTEQGH